MQTRLQAVWHYLELASSRGLKEPEQVHQLRVWIRRALTALKVFRDSLPDRRRRRLKKWLTQLRRAAGEARDLDVLLARLAALPEEPGLQLLCEELRKRRRRAQRPLVSAWRRLKEREFCKQAKRLVASVHWRGGDDEPTFSAAARQDITRNAEQFLSAAARPRDVEGLHQLRVAGKHLRYRMEIYAAAFSDEFRQKLYPLVQEIQAMLGDVNDHATASTLFADWPREGVSEELQATLTKMAAAETQAAETSRRKFVRWFTPARRQNLADAIHASLDGA